MQWSEELHVSAPSAYCNTGKLSFVFYRTWWSTEVGHDTFISSLKLFFSVTQEQLFCLWQKAKMKNICKLRKTAFHVVIFGIAWKQFSWTFHLMSQLFLLKRKEWCAPLNKENKAAMTEFIYLFGCIVS